MKGNIVELDNIGVKYFLILEQLSSEKFYWKKKGIMTGCQPINESIYVPHSDQFITKSLVNSIRLTL